MRVKRLPLGAATGLSQRETQPTQSPLGPWAAVSNGRFTTTGAMMKATARMNEELDAAGVIDPNKREAANVRACRLAGAISRMSATYQQALLTLQRKRTGGSQHVTVKHIHQQVNVTEGGQALVAGDTVTGGPGERRRGMIEK